MEGEGLAAEFLSLELELCAQLKEVKFPPPVSYVYNPLEYAWEPHRCYVQKYCSSPKEVLFLGMNPGPFGMAQTGVPFGEVSAVRDWLGVSGAVGHPEREHPRRPVLGWACGRSEVSGARFWGLLRSLCGLAGAPTFFARCFVHNLCPLAFLDGAGRNLTPADLPREVREQLLVICEASLRRVVAALGVATVVGVGRVAEGRARRALGDGVKVLGIPHPSPRNPNANRGWGKEAAELLRELGVVTLTMDG
ncbi:single-strand-selective monofunctional uracil-DNA glycosylase 1 [Hypanus sabinus]|uniref:single-strand-selective monofunctional uracil-DNA glycosylase 1 n=1 Tax=Hypanus sabinus TaxID=79690 RepID=UPI0028C491AF|nr:single-strand-selective monofunctional uracil-DNA glycosylase 1 [Hypanus sabinus]